MGHRVRSDKSELLPAQLRGESVHFPSLNPLIGDWPVETSPYIDEITIFVNKSLARVVMDEVERQRYTESGLARFVATCFPLARLEMLQFAALYTVWLFIWDDQIEVIGQQENSSMLDDYCSSSLTYTRWALGLPPNEVDIPTETLPPAMVLLRDIAPLLGERLDQDGKEKLFSGFETFILNTRLQQLDVSDHLISTPQQYIATRLGTFGVDLHATCFSFIAGYDLPQWVLDNPEIRKLKTCIFTAAMYMNEYLSFKSEMSRGAVTENLVYALWHHQEQVDFNGAVSALFDLLCRTLRDYSASAERICHMCRGDEHAKMLILELIRHGHHLLAGWYEWQLNSTRYGLQPYVQCDGSLEVEF